MVKQVKHSPEVRLKRYLRRKYMKSDRIAEDADWKDSINIFRLKTREELKEINEKLDYIMQTFQRKDL